MKTTAFVFLLVTLLSPDSRACETSIATYEKSLYPLQRSSCLNCHGDDSVVIPHSHSDVNTAYKNTKKLVSFSSLLESRLIKKIEERHWSLYDKAAKGAEAKEVLALLEVWKNEEDKCAPTYQVRTKDLPVPTDLPLFPVGGYTELRWDLGEVDSKFNGCSFSIDIQQFDKGDPSKGINPSYRVNRPRMICADTGVIVKSIHLPLSGQFDAYENFYQSVHATVSPGRETVLSHTPMTVYQRVMDKPDVIAVTFDVLERKL